MSVMRLNDAAAHGKPNSRTGNLGPMQTLERLENLLLILFLDADSIVPDANGPL